jgi:hypothetical protein
MIKTILSLLKAIVIIVLFFIIEGVFCKHLFQSNNVFIVVLGLLLSAGYPLSIVIYYEIKFYKFLKREKII